MMKAWGLDCEAWAALGGCKELCASGEGCCLNVSGEGAHGGRPFLKNPSGANRS